MIATAEVFTDLFQADFAHRAREVNCHIARRDNRASTQRTREFGWLEPVIFCTEIRDRAYGGLIRASLLFKNRFCFALSDFAAAFRLFGESRNRLPNIGGRDFKCRSERAQ